MADRTFPVGAFRSSLPLQVDPSGREIRVSRFSGAQSVTVHAAGRWQGVLSVPVLDRRSAALASRINAWVGALAGGLSTEIPLPAAAFPTFPAGTSKEIDDVTADNEIEVTGLPIEVADGWWFSVGTRLYQVDQPSLGTGMSVPTFRVIPYGQALRRSALVGENVVPATKIEVTAAGDVDSPRDPDFAGPWIIPFREAA